LERLEKLVTNGLVEDPGARAALLGTEKMPSVRLSEVFPKFEHQTRNEVKDMSPNQLKRWRNGYILASTDFIGVVGDKALDALTHTDVLDYVDWLGGRVEEEEIVAPRQRINTSATTARCSRPSTASSASACRTSLPVCDFRASRMSPGRRSRPTSFRTISLAEGALMGLNEEARRAIMLIADTGLRLSEAINLNETTVHLDCDIPYVQVLPDGRRVKTQDSIREIPLVGTALAAMRLQPKGFPRYVDKGASLSGYVNGFLLEKGLRPTRKHTVYSLRHTFKDRLIAAKCQDSMIEALMGHSDDHPKYGSGPGLDLKLEALHAIAFTPPTTL
jgi:integrase